MFQNLHLVEYDIAGNVLHAWYNSDNKLVFVVDETIDEYKPNVLLVVRSDGTRRWDDLLQNVYNIDLELIRPKRDNKYQKLDIEYSGIDVYEDLIDAYENHGDLNAALVDLVDFRDAAVRRAATVRLANAQDEIAQAQITADKAEHTIKCLHNRMNVLRDRLSRQKSYVGREPTKQSASRILRVEAQIESTDEKLVRAEKRIENARRRIEIATDDANAALALLALRRPMVDLDTDGPHRVVDARTKKSDVAKMPVTDEDIETEEPQDIDMPSDKSDEVKPLLDKDPEILDDKIAFKPVDFGDIKPSYQPELKRPLSPYSAMDDEPKPETVHDDGDKNDAAFGFPGAGDNDTDDDSDNDALPRTDIDDYDDDDYSDNKKKKIDNKERTDDNDADDYGDDEKEPDEERGKSDEKRGDAYDEYKSEIKSRAENDYEKDDGEKSEESVEKREEVVEEDEPKLQESRDDEYENDYSVKPVTQDTVAQDTAAESEFEDNFGHMNFGAYSDNAPEFTEKKFDESWGEPGSQDKSDEHDVTPEPVIDTIKNVDESVPGDVDTTGQVSTAQYDNQGISAPQRPFSPVEVPKMPEERPMSPIQNNEKPRPVGAKRSGVGYYILLILLIALSIFTLWLYQKKNGGTVPFLGLGERTEYTEPDTPIDGYVEPDVPVVLPTPVDVYEPDAPVWTEPEPAPIVAPAPVDKPIEVRFPNDDILRGPEPDVRVIESEEDVLARKEPYGVSRDDKPVLVEVTEPVVEIVTEEPVAMVTTVTAPDVIIEENVVSVPMPVVGEDVETVVEYNNPANVEYVTESYVYDAPQYATAPEYVPAPQPQYVTENYNYVSAPEPADETRRDFSVHDGGQYSVTETVTYRAD